MVDLFWGWFNYMRLIESMNVILTANILIIDSLRWLSSLWEFAMWEYDRLNVKVRHRNIFMLDFLTVPYPPSPLLDEAARPSCLTWNHEQSPIINGFVILTLYNCAIPSPIRTKYQYLLYLFLIFWVNTLPQPVSIPSVSSNV